VILAVLGGGALTTALRASADTPLPTRSAAQLLVDVQTARLEGVSGTVVERADLGLPALSGLPGGDQQLTSLLQGSHTIRVWRSGPQKTRVALLATLGEQDILQNGPDVWFWQSSTNSATHLKATEADKHPGTPSGLPSDLPKTPQEAADRVLAAVDPTTIISTDGSSKVAGRAAYTLTLKPRDNASLVAEVRIAIDGKAHVPTKVEVFAKGAPDRSAFELGFTQVSFARPDDAVFTFRPPPGAKVTEAPDAAGDRAKNPAGPQAAPGNQPKSAVIGKGWTAVLVARMPLTPPDADGKGGQGAAQAILNSLPQVSGAFGIGRVLASRLFTVLVLGDGRVLVGMVSQERLVAVASDPAAALK
jgi:outer membrane lipoprotein-sorting protein